MGILEILERIREKPESARFRILIGATIFITAIIAFVWIATIDLNFRKSDNSANALPGPLKILTKTFESWTSSFRNLFGNKTYVNPPPKNSGGINQ